ncbi:uncharacterized protein LJ206_016055 isoform 1-T1 [Theristicus caerulescens]
MAEGSGVTCAGLLGPTVGRPGRRLRRRPARCPAPAGPAGSPGAGAAAALLEQRLPEERRFLESKGLGAGAVCEPCREAEVICWETRRVSPEPPFFQGSAQRPVSSWTNSSVGQAELASTEQGGRRLLGAGRRGTASVLGASRQHPCARARVTCPHVPSRGPDTFPAESGQVEDGWSWSAPAPGTAGSAVFCSFSPFLGFRLHLTSEGHWGQWKGALGHSGSLPWGRGGPGDCCHPCRQVPDGCGAELGARCGPRRPSPAIRHRIRGSGESCLSISALFNNQRSALFIQDYNWNDNSNTHCASSETHS